MSFLDDQLIKKVPCKTYTTDSAKDIQDDYERGRKAGREAAEQSAWERGYRDGHAEVEAEERRRHQPLDNFRLKSYIAY